VPVVGNARDPGRAALFASVRARLLDAVDHLDRTAFDSAIAEASALAPFDALMSGVLLPLLEEIGVRWIRGETTIASEHFATAAVRQRLLTMIQATSPAAGPLAMLACAPDDHHDVGALYVCLQLAREGWAVTYLGANLPVEEFSAAVGRKRPALVGLSVTLSVPRKRLRGWLEGLGAACAPGARRLCGGPGAREHGDLVTSLGFDLDAHFEVVDRRKTQG
jgi:methanogenic corrinoid protein MtbC1